MADLRKALLLLTFTIYSFTAADNRKFVGGKDCLISQYCEVQNAIEALQNEFGLTEASATEYLDNRTISRSCSCHNSCVYLGVCCQDAQIAAIPQLDSIAERLRTEANAYTCQKIIGEHTVIINTCPSSSAQVLRKKCAEVVEEPQLLATSNATSLNYRNIYCGLCNGERLNNLMGWSWNFDCVKHLPFNENATGSSIVDKAKQYSCKLNKTIPMIPPGQMEIHHSIAIYLDNQSICSAPPISTCPAGTNSEKADCETKPVSLISYKEKVYRNQYCLSCHHGLQSIDMAICEACENENCTHPAVMIHNSLPKLLGSFGILVQPYNDDSVVECKTVDEQSCNGILDTLTKCGYGQYLDYQTTKCVNVCPENYFLKDGSCEFAGVDVVCTSQQTIKDFEAVPLNENSTVQLHIHTFMVLNEGPMNATSCYECNTTKDITSDTKDFVFGDNGEIRYLGNLISPNLVYQVDSVTSYVCLDGVIITTEVKPDYTIDVIVSYFFLSLSMISLLLYFAAYVAFERLRNVPGKIVAGNMLCLFFAYFFFLIRHVPTLVDTPGCVVVGVAINYFFLASFVFNIIYAAFIVHSLEFIDFESNVNKWTALRMWMIGIIIPLFVIIPGILLDQMQKDNFHSPHYGGDECFIETESGKTIYFIVPIGLCLTITVVLYLVIITKLVQIARQTRQVRSDHSEKIAVAIKLIIVLGFNWIFAIIAAAERGRITVLIFIITCSSQGFFGFIVFICNKATIEDIKKYCNKKGKLHFEMSSSTGGVSSKATISSGVKKDLLRPTDSARALLNKSDDASA